MTALSGNCAWRRLFSGIGRFMRAKSWPHLLGRRLVEAERLAEHRGHRLGGEVVAGRTEPPRRDHQLAELEGALPRPRDAIAMIADAQDRHHLEARATGSDRRATARWCRRSCPW
jgi:hypothetical protein